MLEQIHKQNIFIPINAPVIENVFSFSFLNMNKTFFRYVEGFRRTMEWADEVHRGVPGQQSRTAAIFK